MWIFPNTFFRNSHQRCSIRKGVLRNLAEFTGKHLYQSLFFYKVADIRPATLFKKGDPGTGEFLWILLNFKEHLFHRRLLGDCFCFFVFFWNICQAIHYNWSIAIIKKRALNVSYGSLAPEISVFTHLIFRLWGSGSFIFIMLKFFRLIFIFIVFEWG